jgi:aminopeptidase-like protein
MNLEALFTDGMGEEIFAFAAKIYPICRSITGNGLRDTLHHIRAHVPLEIHEVPTGTAVFDWTIPREWNIRDAYIKSERGEKIVDFARSNLHVMSRSALEHAHLPTRVILAIVGAVEKFCVPLNPPAREMEWD